MSVGDTEYISLALAKLYLKNDFLFIKITSFDSYNVVFIFVNILKKIKLLERINKILRLM